MKADRVTLIRDRLTQVLAPQALNIIDESAAHAGHASAGGGGHFVVEIVSDAFQDKTLILARRHETQRDPRLEHQGIYTC